MSDSANLSSKHLATPQFMFARLSHLIAQGFGSGLSPIMPGTVGTLFGWLSFVMLSQRWPQFFTPLTWGVVIVLGFALGVWACEKTGRDIGVLDHGSMVWDEIIAIWLVLWLVMPCNWQTQAAAFVLFRFFDMLKPPPIGYFDRHIKGGLGVMWDDIVAAFFTLLVLALWFALH